MDPIALASLAGALKPAASTKVTQSTSVSTSMSTALSVTNAFGGGTVQTPSAYNATTQTPISTASNDAIPQATPLPTLGAQTLSNPAGAIDNLYGNASADQKTWLAAGVLAILALGGLLIVKRRK